MRAWRRTGKALYSRADGPPLPAPALHMPFRNIAIIAHVDHGKTTLVDQLLRQSGTVRANQQMAERAMDSFDLERERGITILSKCTSVAWQDVRINIVDTPGHADFGGEVERILSMVDGVLILVDAAEGPMPQTKFVTAKALKQGLRPIVVINKADRPDARIDAVHEEIFNLFISLDADEQQLDFPLLVASAKEGWAAADVAAPRLGLEPLFDLVLAHVPPPLTGGAEAPMAMLATTLEADPYLGRLLTGRIHSGRLHRNAQVRALAPDGSVIEQTRITQLLAFRGLEREQVAEAEAGDIVAVAGFQKATVADTIGDPQVTEALAAQPVDPPTLAMTFSINDSPLAGRDGAKVTSRMIRQRLLQEAEGNVAIGISEAPEGDAFVVAGRGELQLGVLIETMRREGYELSISRPRVLYQEDPESGRRLEPIEEVQIDVDDEHAGPVHEQLGQRRAELIDMRQAGGKSRLTFLAPTRGLIGYHSDFLSDTRGSGVMHRVFNSYGPYRGDIGGRANGVLISTNQGAAVAYALWNLEERGPMFIVPGAAVYTGMIIGEHTRGSDLEVNPLKAKQLTNIRAAGKDDAVRLTTPRLLDLESALSYIQDDELIEVTPRSIRLRKRLLDPHARKRAARAAKAS